MTGKAKETGMDRAGLEALLRSDFEKLGARFDIADASPENFALRLRVGPENLRPGGTVAGPSLFALADVAVYLAVLAARGEGARAAVTSACAMDFLRRPDGGRDVEARVRMLKIGRLLAVGDVLIFSDGDGRPVARASVTYALPGL